MQLGKFTELMATFITDVTDRLQSSSCGGMPHPPGLHRKPNEAILQRMERLETILLCSPPRQLSPDGDTVLNELMAQQTLHTSQHATSISEPDSEMSPTKPQLEKPLLEDTSKAINFDKFHESVQEPLSSISLSTAALQYPWRLIVLKPSSMASVSMRRHRP